MHPMIAKKKVKYMKALEILKSPMTKLVLQAAMGKPNSDLGEMLQNLLSSKNIRISGNWYNPETGRPQYVYETINSIYIGMDEPEPTIYDGKARKVSFLSDEMQDKLLECDRLRRKDRKSPKTHIGSVYGMMATL